MKKHFRWLTVLLAIVLVAAACGDDDSSSESADSSDSASTEEEAVEQTQGGDLTFHMITHSDDGPFCSVVKRGMEAACSDVGVNCVWMPGNNDPGQMVSDIETAIGEGSNGIAASLPSPDPLIGPLQDAVAAGVPVYTLNSGLNDYTTIGGFDMTPELLDAIEAGDVAFTVDQQQYLQGYLPVVLMYLEATNANQAGGGLPVLTGPGFVTPDNAAAVKELSAAGTR